MCIGCSEEDSSNPVTPPATTELFPIQPMQTWVYNAESYVNDSLIYRGQDTTYFDSTGYVFASEYWYRYKGSRDQYFWRNGVSGIWRLRVDSYPYTAELYFAYPAQAGDSVIVSGPIAFVKVVSTDETIEVPAGTFSGCYYFRVDYDVGNDLETVWVKPGVGIVQKSVTTISAGDTTRYVSRLRKY
jgi:hypothetical protein